MTLHALLLSSTSFRQYKETPHLLSKRAKMSSITFQQYKEAKKIAEGNPVPFLQTQAVEVLKELLEALGDERRRVHGKGSEAEWKPKWDKISDKINSIEKTLHLIGGTASRF